MWALYLSKIDSYCCANPLIHNDAINWGKDELFNFL
jgi:hypothetical protein